MIDNHAAIDSVVSLLPADSRTVTRVRSLTIDTGDTLRVGQSSTFNVAPVDPLQIDGSLIVNGTLEFDLMFDPSVSYSPSTVFVGNSQTPLQGTGTINFLGATTSTDHLFTSAGEFEIGAGLTVRSNVPYLQPPIGTTIGLGNPNASFVNHGQLIVDGGALSLHGSTYGSDGTMKVAAKAYLMFADGVLDRRNLKALDASAGTVIVAGTLENEGQTLDLGTAGSGGAWQSRGRVHGGTIRGAGGYLAAYGCVLDGVTLAENPLIEDVGGVTIVNGIHGTGTIRVGGATLEYAGVLQTGGTLPNGILATGGSTDLYAGGLPGARIYLSRNEGRIRPNLPPAYAPSALDLIGSSIVNAGALEVTPGNFIRVGTDYIDAQEFYHHGSDADLAFDPSGGSLLVDGGGVLAISGSLDLSGRNDALRVAPRAGGGVYQDQQIVALSLFLFGKGTITGTFDSVTPGITVRYAADGIYISGTPTPEPASISSAVAFVSLIASRRVRRRRG